MLTCFYDINNRDTEGNQDKYHTESEVDPLRPILGPRKLLLNLEHNARGTIQDALSTAVPLFCFYFHSMLF